MAVVEKLGEIGFGEREITLVHLDDPGAPLPDVQRESPHFACLLVMDASAEPLHFERMILQLVHRGAAYISCWGPGCEKVADIVYAPDLKSDWHVMASWHRDEPLEEAVFFLLFVAVPDPAVFDTCRSSVAIVVGTDSQAEEVRKLLLAKGAV